MEESCRDNDSSIQCIDNDRYIDNDSSGKCKNSDNDKDNIRDNDNNSNMKVI